MNYKSMIWFVVVLTFVSSAYIYFRSQSLNERQLALDGSWDFYWMQLLHPEELRDRNVKPDAIQVPSSWNGQSRDGSAIQSHGYATYHKDVVVDPQDVGVSKAIYIPVIGSAYKVWVDGEELAQRGVVGKSIEGETPDIQASMLVFTPTADHIQIVIQVSNYSFREGGILESLQYGDLRVLIPSILKDILRDIMMMGGFLFIGLYHLIIYSTRKNELSILLIGLGGIVAMIRTLFISELLVGQLIPIGSWEILVKIEYMSELIGFMLLILLMKQLYPREVNTIMLRISYGFAICFALYVVSTPARVYTETIWVTVSIMAAILIYFVGYVGILAAIRKREGARINLIAMLIIVIAMVNDTLIATGIIQSVTLLEYSLVNFIFFQAIIVSYRYSLLFKNNRMLASELVAMNRTLEEKVMDRTKELNEKNEQLGNLQITRTRMIANIAHDLGSPIVGIQTYLQLMKEGIVQSGDQDVIQQLYGKSDDMKLLIADLFELTKLESKAITFDLMGVEVNTFIHGIHRKFEPDLSNASFDFRLSRIATSTAGREAFFHIDVFRLTRVIQNFIHNAMKFSHATGGAITLNAYIVDEITDEGSVEHKLNSVSQVRIEVVDQGIGIGPEQLPYVFERFYKKQEDNEVGSGLGLAIAKEIIEQLGGAVGVISELGVGSIFYCVLPIYYEGN